MHKLFFLTLLITLVIVGVVNAKKSTPKLSTTLHKLFINAVNDFNTGSFAYFGL